MTRIVRYVFWVWLVAAAICYEPASGLSWRSILSNFIDLRKNVEPGHPFSEHRIPLDLHLDDIQTTVHTDDYSAHTDLFGKARNFMQGNMSAGAHPRILFSAAEWETMTLKYAKGRDVKGSWYKAFLDYSILKGPGNVLLKKWSSFNTSAYTGEEGMNKTALKIISAEVELMGEYHEGGMFMCALHVAVNEKYKELNGKGYLPEDRFIANSTQVINMIVNYAKILLAHYNTYACADCEYKYGIVYSDLWNTFRSWSVNNDWLTGGLGMALCYDVLHDRMTLEQRRFMRSAFAIMVTGRQHWGITDVSNRYSPNPVLHPHRIFSNWATYHANLFLTNCVIEQETDFDNVTLKIRVNSQPVGFNWDVHDKSIALYDAFMKHSIYPEGSTFEDGYMYSLAFREGSLAFIALAKRGINHIDTPRFRNFIYNAAQMHEPFRCGQFIGHSSGGGGLYPASYALFRYSYPESNLTQMIWAQRMGLNFLSYPCRIWWHQVMIQMSVMGTDHPEGMDWNSQAGLPEDLKKHIHLSIYHPRRGILVARTDLTDKALYFHFDARPDAIFVGHDNADRGVITLSALGRTWLDELPWRQYPMSHVHSIMHVDGQAQALKATAVRMLKVSDTDNVVMASADLTYAYNVQYSRAWAGEWQPFHWEEEYIDGKAEKRQIVYTEKETGNPKDFGWPKGDDTSDLGIVNTTESWGEDHIGFTGIYIWKRKYRQVSLRHAVRSTALIRSRDGLSYVIVGDNFAMMEDGKHSFEMYLILAADIVLHPTSACAAQPCDCIGNPCIITLDGGMDTFLTVQASTIGNQVSYTIEPIDDTGSSRLVIASKGQNFEKFCTVLHPHIGVGNATKLLVRRNGTDTCTVHEHGDLTERNFRFQESNHTFETFIAPYIAPSPSPTPSITPSPSLSSSATPSASTSPSTSTTMSATPSATASISTTPSPSATMSISPSTSTTPSDGAIYIAAITPSPSTTSTPSMSTSPSMSATVSPTPSSSQRPTRDTMPDQEREDWDQDYPIDPVPLSGTGTTVIHADDFTYDRREFFYRRFPYYGEITMDILQSGSGLRNINTCLPGTVGFTYITVWSCGKFGNDAYYRFYSRECTRIPNLRGQRTGECKFRDNFILNQEQGAIYFVVVGVDRVNNAEIQLAISYD